MLTVDEIILIQMAAMQGDWEGRDPRVPDSQRARDLFDEIVIEVAEMAEQGMIVELPFEIDVASPQDIAGQMNF
jgi:hypothetical protein